MTPPPPLPCAQAAKDSANSKDPSCKGGKCNSGSSNCMCCATLQREAALQNCTKPTTI